MPKNRSYQTGGIPQFVPGRNSRGGGGDPSSSSLPAEVVQLLLDLRNSELRASAVRGLCKRKDIFHLLLPILWNSFGYISVLVQEVVSIYPSLSSRTLSPAEASRVCSVLSLFQDIAHHDQTRTHFIAGALRN